MKKLTILSLLIMIFHVNCILANDVAIELQTRLNKINGFYANFIQKVINVNGNLIYQGSGQLWIKRPNLFNWHIVSPDESLLVSDGTNLWYYNPSIKQVTVTLLSEVVVDTPFMLITSNAPQGWKRYHISQHGNEFLLIAKQNKGNLKHFSITIQPNGTIQHFSTIERDGKMSIYQLKNQQNADLDHNKFIFVPPQNVTVDDQRSVE